MLLGRSIHLVRRGFGENKGDAGIELMYRYLRVYKQSPLASEENPVSNET